VVLRERWVAARAEDDAARERWNPPLPETGRKFDATRKSTQPIAHKVMQIK